VSRSIDEEMKRNPYMTEEEWRHFQLWQEARKLSTAQIESLDEQLQKDPSNMDVRVQLWSHYNEYEKNDLKHKNAEQKLSELVLWLIQNKPSLSGFLGHRLATTGFCFKPKTFAALRQAWLEQVSAAPSDETVLGNAASFISWVDLETASDLFERAYALQPTSRWFGLYVIHCSSALWSSPSLYKDEIRERIIDVGVRSLKSEPDGTPFLTVEYVSDAALDLGRLDVVRWCVEILRNMGSSSVFDQTAQAYLGLVALREGDRGLAIQLLREVNQPIPAVFRLAQELFDAGEGESIAELIRRFGRRIKKSARIRWLDQIENGEPPDFRDWC